MLLFFLLACSDEDAGCEEPADGVLAEGWWAGPDGYALFVNADGSADVHMPCADGEVEQATVVSGRVDWTWSVLFEDTAGDTNPDGAGSLTGQVCGDTLGGVLTDTEGTHRGHFVHGGDPSLQPCG